MPDFAIAHLACREPDGQAGCVQQGHGRAVEKSLPRGSPGEGDGIPLPLLAVPPAVQNDEDDASGRAQRAFDIDKCPS